MKNWPTMPLGEVCVAKSGNSKIIKGTLPTENTGNLYPAYSATGQDIFSDNFDFEGDGIIISAVGARCGKCFLANGKWRAIANTHVILPKPDKVNTRYLWYLLNDELFWVKGGTAQPFVKVGDSLKKQIALPPLKEQERIVKLLDEADELRKLRKQTDHLATTLIPALYNEMFGDPEHTRLPVKPLVELVLAERPITYGILKPGADIEDGVPYVRVLDIKQNHLHVHQLQKTTREIADQYRRSILRPGDILITIRGTVGRTCIVPDELNGANITQDTARLAIIPNVEATYVVEFLNTPWAQSWMKRHMLGQAVKGINLGDLRKLPVPVPPLPQQKEFAKRATEIRELEASQATSRTRLEALFQSMLHRAFNGELQ